MSGLAVGEDGLFCPRHPLSAASSAPDREQKEAGTHLRPPSAPASTGPPGAALMASGRRPASAGKMARSCH
ncbi:hypothetical protein QQF64_011524 [Cirrhinus molitorella]|uniref:Uncharacterized protein n=2 Tax=Cirrhinus molitorella TaxID=172907 RepID=A0AA88PE40_9TELE|nr:hypothetical protein Q8A67_019226 [Cirrhinus molitorella]